MLELITGHPLQPTITTAVDSPLGPLRLTASGGALTGLFMHEQRHAVPPSCAWVRDDAWFADVVRQLDEYFAGSRRAFDVPLAPAGTPFQVRVWQELVRIPLGETLTYGELARRIDRPLAPRAVGHANGRNPVSIIIPCHRLVGADGRLTGYGGGLDRKRWLLDHEAATTSNR